MRGFPVTPSGAPTFPGHAPGRARPFRDPLPVRAPGPARPIRPHPPVAEATVDDGRAPQFSGYACREFGALEAQRAGRRPNATVEIELENGRTEAVAVHAFPTSMRWSARKDAEHDED